MTKLSACVTTLNNDKTLDQCLASLQFADELLVLDSGSSDRTVEIAHGYGARVETRTFDNYSAHKQAAIDQAQHSWVLLLDADEALQPETAGAIRDVLQSGPLAAGYRMPRVEQMFWTFQRNATRANRYLRLFDKSKGRMNRKAVHAAPEVDGPVADLPSGFIHYGEPDIATKVSKVNAYSTGLVDEKVSADVSFVRLRMLFYPPFAFVRSYVFKRQFVNGWAGFISAVVMGFYAFLKYAKVLERRKQRSQDLE